MYERLLVLYDASLTSMEGTKYIYRSKFITLWRINFLESNLFRSRDVQLG